MKTLFLAFFAMALNIQAAEVKVSATAQASFNEILNTAMAKSEDVQSKESELRSSEAVLTQAQFRFAPDLQLAGTYAEAGDTAYNRRVSRSYGIKSNLNLFKFGGDYFNLKSADLARESSRWDVQSTRISLEESIAIKILDVIARHQESEIRRKLFESQRDYANVAEKRYGKGILPRQELDKLVIDTRIAEARLKDAELAEYQAQENLQIYSGQKAVEPEWPWLGLLKKLARKNFKFAAENHPQWKTLKNRALASAAFASTKKSELWPSLDLSLGYENSMGALTGYVWTPQWTGLVTLTIPLFSRYESMSASRQAVEEQVRADLALRKAGRELEASWKVAEKDFHVQLESAVTREQTIQTSRGLYQDNFHRFQTGRSNANDLFNDQERLYQTELLAIQGWYAVHVSYIKLCHSVGLLIGQCDLSM